MSAIVLDSKVVKPIVMTGYVDSEPIPPIDDRFVDLGLPSGNLWARYNIGVNPNDLGTAAKWYGDKHSWACADDESSKSSFLWSNYKWKGSDDSHFTKYTSLNASAESGTADGKRVIEQADDIAYATYGAGAKVPTLEDWKELYDNCTGEDIVNYNGISGLRMLRLTSDINGKELLLPLCNVIGKSIDYVVYNYPSCEKLFAKSTDDDAEFRYFQFWLEAEGGLDSWDYEEYSRYYWFYYRAIKQP